MQNIFHSGTSNRPLMMFNTVLVLILSAVVCCGLLPELPTQMAFICAVATGVAMLAARPVMFMARALGAVDMPGGRRIHERPTPRLGGAAVAAGVFAALAAASSQYMPKLQALLTGSLMVFAVGAIDDVRPVKAWLKLLVQLAAAVLLIANGVMVTIFPPYGAWMLVRWTVTILWLVGITNAVNFLDGMDGLVSGWTLVVCSIYCTLALLLGRNILAYCSMALFGAVLGFLAFNIKPARIFLGDSGSSFIGFFLAALSMQGNWSRYNPLISFCIPIFVLSVPIYDMVFTTVERLAVGKVRSFVQWLEYTGRDHLHHRLEALGLSRGQVVLVICFLAMAVGLSAVAIYDSESYVGITLIVQNICIYGVFALLELLGRGRLAQIEKDEASGQNPVSKAAE